ncbi:MAG: FKBP-type peptidyl-prolyl cis-trans isomerase [Lachnospiraceae bacterium]|nr:FKBP-type peptidyl-prolyl cis-trans isomerase [Lachnospiraceae bacterium]
MKKKYLKRFAIACATVLLCGALTACDQGGNKSSEAGNTESSQSGTAETVSNRVYAKDLDLNKYVTLKDYSSFRVERDGITISEDEVEELMTNVYNNSFPSELGITDRAVENGDWVKIDFEGKKDGVAFDGGTAEDYALGIGTGSFIDGFEDGLIGVMPGETVDLNLTFPEIYHDADLAGQDVVFTVKVRCIIPEEKFDEAVDGIIPEVSTVQELRDYVRSYLEDQAALEGDESYEEKIMDQFLETMCEFGELPAESIQYYRELMNNNIVMYALQMGTDPETLMQTYYQMSLEDFLSNYADLATRRELAMMAVATKEGLLLDDDAKLETALNEMVTAYEAASAEEFLSANSMTREDFRQDYAYEKAFEFIIALAQGN